MMASAAVLDPAGSPAVDVIRGGCAVELVHIGSLYHDDVMDDATTRRSIKSVNAEWGNLQVAGDYLLGRASELASDLGTEVAGLLATTIRSSARPDPRTRVGLRPDPHHRTLRTLHHRQDGIAARHGLSHRCHRRRTTSPSCRIAPEFDSPTAWPSRSLTTSSTSSPPTKNSSRQRSP